MPQPTTITNPSSIFDTLVSNFVFTFITVGIIILFVTIGSTSIDSLNGSIAGYALIAAGILVLVSLLFYNGNENKSAESLTNNNRWFIMSFLYTAGPFIITIAIISIILYLLGTYKDRIAQGHFAPGYVNFTNISIVLILLQLLLFYFGTQKESFKTTSRLDRVYSGLLYFIGILNIVAVTTIWIILKYFSTDG